MGEKPNYGRSPAAATLETVKRLNTLPEKDRVKAAAAYVKRKLAQLDAPEKRIMTHTDLYDVDILLWSEQQAELLRQRSANALDWDHLAEEIGDVGRSELHTVMSHLRLALLHDLKADAWPLSRDEPHWRAEARGHRDQARDRFTPSMAQRIDMVKLYHQALRSMPATIDGALPLPVPTVCPVSLEEMLSEDSE